MNKNTIVCRCEEVSYHLLLETAQKYNCSSRELKLRTRAGMGYCGGRTCGSIVTKISNTFGGKDPINKVPLKNQAPIRPVAFSTLERNESYGENNKSSTIKE
ncbi:MAG TPA: (2Fe-2S)-binding protein [Pseudogracilibacillus sp.]|nr:(2Fe-2S)-binding protein [Pseudogracilibacillus sp.]